MTTFERKPSHAEPKDAGKVCKDVVSAIADNGTPKDLDWRSDVTVVCVGQEVVTLELPDDVVNNLNSGQKQAIEQITGFAIE